MPSSKKNAEYIFVCQKFYDILKYDDSSKNHKARNTMEDFKLAIRDEQMIYSVYHNIYSRLGLDSGNIRRNNPAISDTNAKRLYSYLEQFMNNWDGVNTGKIDQKSLSIEEKSIFANIRKSSLETSLTDTYTKTISNLYKFMSVDDKKNRKLEGTYPSEENIKEYTEGKSLVKTI